MAARRPKGKFFEISESENPWDVHVAVEILRKLFDAGADINATDKSGRTPLHRAAEFSFYPDVISTLLDTGADAKIRDQQSLTAYDIAKDNSDVKGSEAYWRLNDGAILILSFPKTLSSDLNCTNCPGHSQTNWPGAEEPIIQDFQAASCCLSLSRTSSTARDGFPHED